MTGYALPAACPRCGGDLRHYDASAGSDPTSDDACLTVWAEARCTICHHAFGIVVGILHLGGPETQPPAERVVPMTDREARLRAAAAGALIHVDTVRPTLSAARPRPLTTHPQGG